MSATFGRLDNATLTLSPGLNLIEAPNESGKSTWCAFVCNMLYGLPTRSSGPLAEKNRYAPWNGTSMSGVMELEWQGHSITLRRDTPRATAPLGRFEAVYTGTSEPVPELTGQNCGEMLLGVPREVFERSALIRQAGLAVDQTAELERRIVSLITTGAEDTSYIESHERLKKQLNRRQSNSKTGQIPALNARLEELSRQLAHQRELEGQLLEQRQVAAALQKQEGLLLEELALHHRWEAFAQRDSLRQTEKEMAQKESAAAALRRRLEEERIPENETIGRLRGAIVNLETVRKSVDKAREERDNAHRALYRAEDAVAASPFAGQSAESARRESAAPPSKKDLEWKRWPTILTLLLGWGSALAAAWAALSPGTVSGQLFFGPIKAFLLPLSVILLVGSCILAFVLRKRAIQTAKSQTLQKRFATSDPTAIAALAEAYAHLLTVCDTARADLAGKSAAAESLNATLISNEQGILLEIRRFAPAAFDISTADTLLRQCAVRRRELTEAESAARDARVRWEAQGGRLPEGEAEQPSSPLPVRSAADCQSQLEEVRGRLAAARSTADGLSGQLLSLGEPGALSAEQEEVQREKERLEQEYAALSLALDTLSSANTELQNRFSPALGQRAAEIFCHLSEGKYHKIFLDRQLSATAEEADSPLPRNAALLSQGAIDQLYLSLRLAICDLVLPQETAAPLILDDTLINFDDRRCRAALETLKAISRERQILLFSCQGREGDLLAGDPTVSIQRLS